MFINKQICSPQNIEIARQRSICEKFQLNQLFYTSFSLIYLPYKIHHLSRHFIVHLITGDFVKEKK